MPTARGNFSRFEFDGNTIDTRFPLDTATAAPQVRQGSEFATAPSGETDAWVYGFDETLTFTVRWISEDSTTNPYGHTAAGWSTSGGWADFLKWIADAGEFEFYPDKDDAGTSYTCVLAVEGGSGISIPRPSLEDDGTKRLTLTIRTTDDTPIVGF